MLLRLFLLLVMLSSLDAQEKRWYDKIHPSVEAGMHLSNFDGSLKNAHSLSYFKDDYGYKNTSSSYFALDVRFDYDYAPNIIISYFNDKQDKYATLKDKVYVADGEFDAGTIVYSTIDYQVTNVTLYKDFKKKGTTVKLYIWEFYPGDIEFDAGMNFKVVKWKFNINDTDDLVSTHHWVDVDVYIPLPYLGFKYYYYNFRAFGSVSALSLSEAKSTNYEVGVDYRLIDNLFISASYLYEGFKATEKTDIINFKTIGNKFSFKYAF